MGNMSNKSKRSQNGNLFRSRIACMDRCNVNGLGTAELFGLWHLPKNYPKT